MSSQLLKPPSLAKRFSAGFLCTIAGILSAMSFVVSAQGYRGMSDTPASPTSMLWCALAICFGLLYWQVYVKKGLRVHASNVVFGLIFGVVNTLGSMLFAYDSWVMLGNVGTLGLTMLRCIGQAFPMMACFAWLHALLFSGTLKRKSALEDWQPKRFAGIARFYRKHRTLSLLLLLILCWSPYLLAFFPGTVCWDLGEMVAQFFGQRPMDTWHPVFTTWIMGGCVWLGRLIGSDNLGAALFTLLQTVVLAYALARVIDFLRRLHTNRVLRGIAVLFFALAPIWGGYAQFISKDTLYTATMLLFVLKVLEIVVVGEAQNIAVQNSKVQGAVTQNTQVHKLAQNASIQDMASQIAPAYQSPLNACTSFAASSRSLVALFTWALLCCLLRSNGLYVVLPTAVLLLAFGLHGIQTRLHVGIALAGAVVVALLFSNALLPVLGVRDETASGIYSVCFQQSARVLRDHATEVTPEEFAEIDQVLDAENLAMLYEPWISDPVKYTFKQYGMGAALEKDALARYQKTWLSMFKKYPLSYVETFFAGNVSYYAFTPKMVGETYNNQAGNRLVFETYDLGADPRFLHSTQISALEPVRKALAMFARGWRHIPLLSLLYTCAAYTWLLVGAGISIARQRRWRLLVGFAPALLCLGVCMLGPVNDYFRYFLPIVAMTLPLLGFSSAEVSEKSKA